MKNKDNQMKSYPDLYTYDEMFQSKDEIYYYKGITAGRQEMDIYSSRMNSVSIEEEKIHKKRLKTITLSTGVLAIVIAILFVSMKRFNQNVVYNISCEVTSNKLEVIFDYEEIYDITLYYGIKDSKNRIIVRDSISDTAHIDRSFVLDSGEYKFVIYEEFYDYTLNYYESDVIRID